MSYLHVLLVFMAAVVFLLVQILIRKHRQPPATRLLDVLEGGKLSRDPGCHDYLVPLLVYEEDFPAFTHILGTVLDRFPLERFLGEELFKATLLHLRDTVFRESNRKEVIDSMSFIVDRFISDPDVEYQCRPHLKKLVHQFLREVEQAF